jgi:L-ascorbate metabolism protein UlaG (beta-lactamase superfamily)
VEIVWHGHMGFHVTSGNTSLLMDPFDDSSELRIPHKMATVNLITSSIGTVPDRNRLSSESQSNTPPCLTGPGEYEIAGAYVKAIRVPAPQGDGQTSLWNTIFVVNLEGIIVCHLGNPARMLTTRQIEDIGSPHILILAVGSENGLTVIQAVETINAISPRVTIPMAFSHPGNNNPGRELTPFLQEFGGNPSAEGQPKLTITRASLPEDPQLVVLRPTAATS